MKDPKFESNLFGCLFFNWYILIPEIHVFFLINYDQLWGSKCSHTVKIFWTTKMVSISYPTKVILNWFFLKFHPVFASQNAENRNIEIFLKNKLKSIFKFVFFYVSTLVFSYGTLSFRVLNYYVVQNEIWYCRK